MESFIDEGDNNMLAVMQELVRVKYKREDLSRTRARIGRGSGGRHS